jgi:hypothetical protein
MHDVPAELFNCDQLAYWLTKSAHHPIDFAATSHPGKCWRLGGYSRKQGGCPRGADAGLCKLDGERERCQRLREFALFGAKKWRHSPKVINIGQRRRVAIPYRSSIMLVMNVAAATATEFAVCFYDCGHEACAQGHAIAVSFCRLSPKRIGYSKGFHQDASRTTGDVHSQCRAEEVVHTVQQERPCVAA